MTPTPRTAVLTSCDCSHTAHEHTDRGEQDAGLCLHPGCDCPEFVEDEAQAAPPDALREDGSHCGFVFEAGTKCYADEGHPVHHGKWNWLNAVGGSKFDIRGPEPDHDYQPESHEWGVKMCQHCGTRAAALAAPAGYRGRGANRNNPSLPVAAALDPADARTLLRYVEAVLTEIAADVEVGITATAGARRARDDIRAFFAAPATLPAIDTRIVWKRDHGMVIVTGDEEPQSLEIPAWAVRTIFDVAGKDPEEEARKVSAFINAHTGLDEAASRLYDTVRLMRSTVGHTHKEPWPCPVFEVDQALRSLARIIDPRYERPYPPDLDAIRKARIAAHAEQGDAGER